MFCRHCGKGTQVRHCNLQGISVSQNDGPLQNDLKVNRGLYNGTIQGKRLRQIVPSIGGGRRVTARICCPFLEHRIVYALV